MERKIVEYRKVKYIGHADADGDAIGHYRSMPQSLEYIEGYIRLGLGRFRHSWVFDPREQVAYEVRKAKHLKELGFGELKQGNSYRGATSSITGM